MVIVILLLIPFVWLFIKYLNMNNQTLMVDPNLEEFDHERLPADDDIDLNMLDGGYWYHKDVINILLVGCDYGDAKQFYPRSDSMIIASINKRAKTISFVSLSRATYVAIEGHKNNLLNRAYAFGGPDLLVDTIEKNYKIRLDYYISVDFDGFVALIDILGGVDVYLSSIEAQAIGVGSDAGTYHLEGNSALAFARVRSIDTDRARTGRQRNIMISLTKKAMKISSFSVFNNLLDKILPYVSTDLKYFDILTFGSSMFVNQMYAYSIKDAVVPTGYVPLTRVGKMDVLICDWETQKNDIHSLLYQGLEEEIAQRIAKEKAEAKA